MTDQIPRDFIDMLLNRVEIIDLIDSRITLKKKTGSNYFACCPFHNEKNPSFSVSQTKQFYYCFGCGAHGNAIDFLIQYDRLNFPEAIEVLARQVGVEVPKQAFRNPSKTSKQQSLYDLLEKVATFFQTQLRLPAQSERVVGYLKQRGLSGNVAKHFEIGFAPSSWDALIQAFPQQKPELLEAGMLIKKDDGGYYDRFRDRLMFPIRDRRGRIIGFGGRIIDQGEPKYLNSPETTIFQKGHELYGLYQALQTHRQLNTILVVEGYMDVIALFQHDITYAVATLGTATTANHIERLFRHTTEVTFCFDGDTAGRSAAWRALQTTLPLMHDGVQVRFMFLADGEDPDSLVRKEGKEQFEKLMQTALPIAEFFFQSLAAQTDTATTDGRARFVKLATDLLKNLPAGVFNQMMFDELARRARIDVNQLQPQNTQTASHTLTKPNQTTSARAKPPSTLRLAMMLIVQQPALAHSVEGELPDLDITGYDLFKKVFEQAKTIPDLTTGSLLEQWRDQPEAALLAKLANTEHMIPEAGVPNEFQALIKNLHKLVYEKSIEVLLTKAAMTGLSNDEKVKLSELIRDKP